MVVVVVVAAVSLLGYEEKCVGLFMVVLSSEKERDEDKRERERERWKNREKIRKNI